MEKLIKEYNFMKWKVGHEEYLRGLRWEQLKKVSEAFEFVARMAHQHVPEFYQEYIADLWEDDDHCVVPREVLEEMFGPFNQELA